MVIPAADMGTATSEQLINQFKNDVVYDAHSVRARVDRSGVAKEMRRRGPNMLADIAKYLKDPVWPEFMQEDLNYAWRLQLAWTQDQHDLGEAPDQLEDLQWWITWAEANAA